MRVLAVENYRSTPLGQVGAALAEAGAEVDLRRAHLGEPLPETAAEHDAIVILGGEQNALADDACPWFPKLVEFGWHEVRPTAEGRNDPVLAGVGAGSPIFHWHEDTFTLPPGALHLARSAMTENQAFRLGRAVYGIQFHFEADRPLVAGWSEDFAETIHGYAPDWPERHPLDAARHGPRSDAAGLDLARRWVRLVKPSAARRRAESAT